MKANRSNLSSPSTIKAACDLDALRDWLESELTHFAKDDPAHPLVRAVAADVDSFVKFSTKTILLWSGCDRTDKYHRFPSKIQSHARENKVLLDGRANGPAIAAFLIAGGVRPCRLGSKNCWSIHHLYSGKFPYLGKTDTTHAAKNGLHFTQSAGLVAVHPVADSMCDEYPCFAWYLRAIAYKKFGYDPDAAFSNAPHDSFGFVGATSTVFHCKDDTGMV